MDDQTRDSSEDLSADRRTGLAVERTKLAWWRTGLTALAVAIGVGRVVPELSDATTSWPYAVIGIAFAIYGVSLFLVGNSRARADGQSGASDVGVELALAAAGPALGVVVIALIAFTA